MSYYLYMYIHAYKYCYNTITCILIIYTIVSLQCYIPTYLDELSKLPLGCFMPVQRQLSLVFTEQPLLQTGDGVYWYPVFLRLPNKQNTIKYIITPCTFKHSIYIYSGFK